MNRKRYIAIRLPFYYGWAIVAIGVVVWIITSGLFNIDGVFLKPVAGEFGWSRGSISGAFSLAAVLAGAFAIITGALTDRYGPRVVVLGGGLLVTLGLSLLSRIQALWQFYLFWAIVGMGKATFNTPTAATVSRWFTDYKRRGLALGITTAGAGLGQVLLPPLATFLIARTEWRTAFLLLGLMIGATLLVLAPGLKNPPQDRGPQPHIKGETATKATPSVQGFSFPQAVRTQALWRIMLACAFAALAFGTVTVHIIPYAIDAGITPMAAATLISVRGLTMASGRMLWGAAEGWLGNKRAFTLSLALAALPFLFLPLTTDYALLLSLAAFLGFAQGGFSVSRYGLLGELFGMTSIGAIMGVSEAGTLLGWGLGAVLAGYIFDLAQSYLLAFLASALWLLLAAGLIFTLKPLRRNE